MLVDQIVYDKILTFTSCSCNFFGSGGAKTLGTMHLIIVVTLFSLGCVKGQFFEDRRCRCICPSPSLVLNSTNTRQIYTGNVPPNKCDCEGVVYPLIGKELEGKLHIFCPRCECVYQTRNTTLIMSIVFAIMMTISMLLLYIATFTWLKALIGRFQETRQIANPAERERDFIREHRGEYLRDRQREQERLRMERAKHNLECEEVGLLDSDAEYSDL